MKTPKKKILVSFSGGETSGYMINWLLLNKPKHEYKFVFANTGEENEETLIFVKKCQDYFNIDLTWVEYDLKKEKPTFKVVDFKTAYRSHNKAEKEQRYNNHPFRKAIKRQGIPGLNNFICTRELKEYPIRRYMNSIGWKPSMYDIAIGIRADEIDRIGKHYYPLVQPGITKPIVNAFWDKMPFRLQLKGYQGNCKTCWKKSTRKLGTIALENPEHFDFFKVMEEDYDMYIPESHVRITEKDLPRRFFREYKSVEDILKIPNAPGFEVALDDSVNTNYQTSILHDGTELDISNGCIESCEVF
jgi:hypothetical protein